MKRSRACGDLVALAEEAAAVASGRCGGETQAWQALVDAPVHRLKRSRSSVVDDFSRYSFNGNDLGGGHSPHSLECMLGGVECECLADEMVPSSPISSTLSTMASSVRDDDGLSLYDVSPDRDTSNPGDSGSDTTDPECASPDLPKFQAIDTSEDKKGMSFWTTTESRQGSLVRSCSFSGESQYLKCFESRQDHSFDLSAFTMLAISSKR